MTAEHWTTLITALATFVSSVTGLIVILRTHSTVQKIRDNH